MRVRVLLLAVVFAVAALTTPARAQNYFPETIKFSGSTLSQERLLAFTGLKSGRVTKEQMQAASDKLHATGLFSEVKYELDDDVLAYVLTPASTVLPVRYDNFPWWDAATLNSLVAKKVPLFDGALYPGGPMRKQVIEALTALLAEKGVDAQITTTPVGDAHGVMIATRFQIYSPPILISSFVVEGASDAWAPAIKLVEESAVGKDFSRATPDSLAAAVRGVYARKGYLDAVVTNPVWGTPKLVDGKYLVPLTATIASEGQPYTVSAVQFAGNAMTNTAEFALQAKIHAGQVADGNLVDQTAEVLKAPWRARGYQLVTVDTSPVLDRVAHTVAYSFTVNPGAVYRMGTLTLVGLDKRQERLVRTYWQLPKGAVCEPGRAFAWRNVYLNARGEELVVADKLEPMHPSYEFHQHEDTHTVDVVITFSQPKPVQNPGDFHPFGPLH
jgi:outer membrane protein insertion porin family